MLVSRGETGIGRLRWRGMVCASLFFASLLGAAAAAAVEPRFFRIGTAATGGSYFEIGGMVAGAISGPTGGPPCDRGGSCGVPGLVAVAQATPGSIDNLRLIDSLQLESGFAQADIAGWAYHGTKAFAEAPLRRLRAIASLFPEAAHLVVRADSKIDSIADLAGKTVSLGETGSGTAADAKVLLAAAGFGETDLKREYLRPGPSAEALKDGTIDAFFLVGGYPVPAIRNLASTVPIRLIPIEGKIVDRLRQDFSLYYQTEIPGGTYPGLDAATPTMGFSALWLANAGVDADLVYAITKSLWNPATAKLLTGLDPIGRRIQPEHALDGLSVPLHPGAERYYREAGMPVGSAPQAAAGPEDPKKP